jgi:hypothetical protein
MRVLAYLQRIIDALLEELQKQRRRRALRRLRALSRPFPPGFKFDREEIHDRFTRSHPD